MTDTEAAATRRTAALEACARGEVRRAWTPARGDVYSGGVRIRDIEWLLGQGLVEVVDQTSGWGEPGNWIDPTPAGQAHLAGSEPLLSHDPATGDTRDGAPRSRNA